MRVIGLLDDAPMVRQAGIASTGPNVDGMRNGTFGQSGLKRNFLSGQAKPLM